MPTGVMAAVIRALEDLGDTSPVIACNRVCGGYVSSAAEVVTGRRRYFLKWCHGAAPDMFIYEMRGIRLLRDIGNIEVPNILCANNSESNSYAYMLQEWIPQASLASVAAHSWELLALAMVALHSTTSDKGAGPCLFGLDYDNYLGLTPQLNSWDADWIRFFRDSRLQPACERACRAQLLSVRERRQMEILMGRLARWIGGIKPVPSLLHGDFWKGNVLFRSDGRPVLIDPAVYFGHREVDIAHAELITGIPGTFFHVYRANLPLELGYDDRRDIYNLWYLLDNIVAGSKKDILLIRSILDRYVGW